MELFYCPPGSLEEIPCPSGYYCGEKTEVPIPCPKGTFHDTDGAQYIASQADCTVCTEGYFCDGEGLHGTQLTGPRIGVGNYLAAIVKNFQFYLVNIFICLDPFLQGLFFALFSPSEKIAPYMLP